MFQKPTEYISTDTIQGALDLGPYPTEKKDKAQQIQNVSVELLTKKESENKEEIEKLEILKTPTKIEIENIPKSNTIESFDPSNIVWL